MLINSVTKDDFSSNQMLGNRIVRSPLQLVQLLPPLDAAAVVNIVPRSIPMQQLSMLQILMKMAVNTFAHFFIR